MKILLVSLLLTGWALGVTKEVVRVFLPVSYHDTDSATEYGVKGDLIQAAVVDQPVVLSGAFPEDLIKAVSMPLKLASNNPTYEVTEANLFQLCGLQMEVAREGELVEVLIDCSQLQVPEVVELSLQQILKMTIEAIRRTVRVYYRDDAHESFQCEVSLRGLDEGKKALKSLEEAFQVGTETELKN